MPWPILELLRHVAFCNSHFTQYVETVTSQEQSHARFCVHARVCSVCVCSAMSHQTLGPTQVWNLDFCCAKHVGPHRVYFHSLCLVTGTHSQMCAIGVSYWPYRKSMTCRYNILLIMIWYLLTANGFPPRGSGSYLYIKIKTNNYGRK